MNLFKKFVLFSIFSLIFPSLAIPSCECTYETCDFFCTSCGGALESGEPLGVSTESACNGLQGACVDNRQYYTCHWTR